MKTEFYTVTLYHFYKSQSIIKIPWLFPPFSFKLLQAFISIHLFPQFFQ